MPSFRISCKRLVRLPLQLRQKIFALKRMRNASQRAPAPNEYKCPPRDAVQQIDRGIFVPTTGRDGGKFAAKVDR